MERFYPEKIFSHCPRCGADRLSFRQDGSFICETCEFVYYINAAAAVIAIITNENGDILFTRRAHDPSKGMLDLPGGFVDIMETAEDALVREISEELNLEISNLTYIRSFPNRYLFRELVYFTLDLVFLCSIKDMARIRLSEENTNYHFINPREVRYEDIGLESVRNVIRFYNEQFQQ